MSYELRLPRVKSKLLFIYVTSWLILTTVWIGFYPQGQWESEHGKISYDYDEKETKSDKNTEVKSKNKVVILMWSNYYSVKGEALLKLINTKGIGADKKCFDGVEVTLDRKQLEKADAVVIFHYFGNLNMADLPKTRRPDQLWILFGKESPTFSPSLKPFNNLFNWTMTYKKNSDIFAPIGDYVKLEEEKKAVDIDGVPLDTFIGKKSGLIAGNSWECTTRGKWEEFLKQLGKVGDVKVNIYGGCGKHICGKSRWCKTHKKWTEKEGAKYKFFFAPEKVICTDYITAGFWKALELGMVPVGYGGAKYSQLAPPHSYIDVKDFKSVKELGKYLKKLDKNEKEYKKYFEWRKKYKVRIGEGWQGWCELGKKVKEFKRESSKTKDPRWLKALSSNIKDLGGWWGHKDGSKKAACMGPLFKYKIKKDNKKKG